jgi:serine phosphatase RsbU (regulator of sigma subunit)
MVIDEIYRSVIEFGGGDRPKDDASVIVIQRLD